MKLFFTLFLLFVLSMAARATTFTVNQSGDAGDGTCDATCTLRDAVAAANAAAGDDAINFAAGLTTITLVNSDITITNNGSLTINGLGANVLTIDGGAGTNRIFYSNGATLTVSGVTLTGGNGTGAGSNGNGGAILAIGGSLVLNGVHVTANSAGSQGGGLIFSGGTNHQIINSTISGNNAAGSCAGLRIDSTGTLLVVNSTISGNTGSSSTVGGGVCSASNATLRNVTITNNTAATSSGIALGGGTLDIGNTIVAGNIPNDISNAGGTITSAGYNLIGDNLNATREFPAGNPNANKDIVGTPGSPINPLLGALTTGNGGTTPTHALLTGSPAIDKGNSFGFSSDQRGSTRPVDMPSISNQTGGDGADIGAFEVQPAPAVCTAIPSGLVAWYRAEGNAIDSALGNNGALQGGATYASGMVGQAFSLNGTNAFVQAPNTAATDPTTAGSQEAWVRFNQLPSAAGTMQIIGKGGVGTDFDLTVFQDNLFRFQIQANVNVPSTTVAQTGVWYHVVGTWDATGIRIYVNGVLENTNSASVTRNQSGQPLQIGNQPVFGPRFFSGLIDEPSVYNRALSASEVQAIYNAGSAGKCFAPTAASVTVGGRVTTFKGRGIARAQITLTSSSGESRAALTNSFGYFRLDEVSAGETYIFEVRSKQYRFADSPRILFVGEDFDELNFTALP